MKNRSALVFTLFLCGCYTTKVYTPTPAQGPKLHDRQWFTLGGLVDLSDPTGQQCPEGVSKAESKFAAVDILVDIGLAVVGGVAGAVACRNETEADRNNCTTLGAGLVPFFIASRTVEFTCAGRGGAAEAPTSRPAQPPPVARRELHRKQGQDASRGELADTEIHAASPQ